MEIGETRNSPGREGEAKSPLPLHLPNIGIRANDRLRAEPPRLSLEHPVSRRLVQAGDTLLQPGGPRYSKGAGQRSIRAKQV